MSLVARSIPGLFGGVSQQIPAMRHPTQGTEQLNGLATTVDGLYKRPGSRFLATLALTGANGASVNASYGSSFVHWLDKGDAGLYALILVAGNLMLYNALTGATQTVAFPNGTAYLGGSPDPEVDFRCLTVADYTFIANLKKVPAMTAAVAPANATNVAYFQVRTAVPSVPYRIVINGNTVSTTTGATPTNASIASDLATALVTAWPSDTVFVIPGTNVVKFIKNVSTLASATCSDGWGNVALTAVHTGVDAFADLPPKFEAGYVLTINGSASQTKDVYYVKWNGLRYEECLKPGLSTTLDAATMPHQLRPDGTGGWVFEQVPLWGQRKAGDDDTNPLPSFIGTPIRQMFFHRNRLGFLSADAMVLSRAGAFFEWFGSSATQVLATDPIDLSAPAKEVDTLDQVTGYNESLVVWASNGQQFVLTAGDVLTPETARLLPSTTFDSYNGAEPAALGNRLMFASSTGSNMQLNLYRVSTDTVTNASENLTEHAPRYVPNLPRALVASTSVKALVVVPRGVSQSLPFFKYEVDDNDRMTQKAWSEVRFESPDAIRIMAAVWRGRKLYLVLHSTCTADVAIGGRYRIEVIDFEEQAQDDQCGFALRLDTAVKVTAGAFAAGNTSITLPFLAPGTIKLLKCVAGAEPVDLVVTGAVSHNTVTLASTITVVGNHTGAVVWAGRPFMFRYVFTEAILRDREGLPIMSAVLKLVSVKLRYRKTGYFAALVKNAMRATFTYPVDGHVIGLPNQGPSVLALTDGEFRIPVQAKAAAVEVSLESTSYFPVNVPYAEWVADVTMKATR